MSQSSFFLTVVLASSIIRTGYKASEIENSCPILTHQKNITISQIMGTWYVTRGMEHTNLNPTNSKPGSSTDCRALTVNKNEQSEIIFQWNGNNVYNFKMNENNPNLLQNLSTSKPNGSSIKTLQVTEVDDKHIVITSCSESKRISSALLSREPKFNEQQALAAVNKLTEQGLKTISSFDKCQSKP